MNPDKFIARRRALDNYWVRSFVIFAWMLLALGALILLVISPLLVKALLVLFFGSMFIAFISGPRR